MANTGNFLLCSNTFQTNLRHFHYKHILIWFLCEAIKLENFVPLHVITPYILYHSFNYGVVIALEYCGVVTLLKAQTHFFL
jgi:hypothetical protein